MPDVIVNVTPQPTASVEVDVDNVASYYYDLAKQWAISPNLVEQLDYSSKYYANKSKEAAESILTDAGFIAVSQDLTNIDTVATSIANVNTTAGNITNINTVAGISSNVTTVAGISSDVTAVNNNATNINTVAGISTDVTSVASISSDISAVNNNSTNINACVANETNINACVANETNINAVASNATNINTVAGDKTNIDTVASISGNITTVAGISTDVTSVASISSAVSAVNTNANNINTCATNISDINVCAANIPSLQDKANTAGDNFTLGGKLNIAKFVSLASNVKSAIPVGSSGFTYTANMTGFVFIQATGTTPNGFIYLVNDTTSIAFCNFAVAAGYVIFAFVPVKTNDIIHVDYAGVTIDVANLIHSNIYQ